MILCKQLRGYHLSHPITSHLLSFRLVLFGVIESDSILLSVPLEKAGNNLPSPTHSRKKSQVGTSYTIKRYIMKHTIHRRSSVLSTMSRYICAFTIASTLIVSTVAQTTEPTPAPQDLSTNVSNESFVSFF